MSSAAATYPSAADASQTDLLPAGPPTSAGRADGQLPPSMRAGPGVRGLPRARTVLAVTARPGAESTALGGLLYAFGQAGARTMLLSLTRGEASPFNSTTSRLEAIRPWELQLASWLLDISSVAVADFPDGGLTCCPMPDLTERVRRAITGHDPDLILVLDPAAGNADDAQVAQAVSLAAGPACVPVAASMMPGASGGWVVELGAQTEVARAVQRAAARAHSSQCEALPEELGRLDGLSGQEQLRRLVPGALRRRSLSPAVPCLD